MTKSNMTVKEIWTAKNTSDCKHKRVEHNKIGWKCLDCWAYIDKDMITNLDKL